MWLKEVTHRCITATHYLENKKYMIWYRLDKEHGGKTIGFVQVRGLNRPLTEEELKTHIDKLIERSRSER